jgi:hypothetical protein
MPALLILALRNAAESRYLDFEDPASTLRLQATKRLHSRFATDLQRNTRGRRLGVVHRFRAGLDVGVDSVVVRGGESLEVIQTVHGDGIFGGIVTDGGCPAAHFAVVKVVRGLGANEESVAPKDGICSECRALNSNASS